MTQSHQPWPRRHPILMLLALNGVLFLFVALLAELALRWFIPFNPGFYMSVGGTSSEVEYPYGTIKINSGGFPDDEFDVTKENRVGYFGDSVTYGVGAGYGYRFSEILEESYPHFEHMNFGGIGLSVSQDVIQRSKRLAAEYELDVAIYFFNMNDIVTTQISEGKGSTAMGDARNTFVATFDWLRGKSFLYTYVRTSVKNLLEAQGVGFHGYSAFELHPTREREVLRETAERINAYQAALASIGVELIVVLLPYEMQISQEAEEEYASAGIDWEDGFIERSTQQILTTFLSPDIRTIDAYFAFVNAEDPEAARLANGLGEYFVYDKGDKLDWNHPNRKGHRAIAEYLATVNVLGPPGPPGSS